MKIIPCLLDSENQTLIDSFSLGQLLTKQGKAHLWGDRSGTVIDTVVIHSMSAVETNPHNPYEIQSILQIFVIYDVSSHYLIDREGNIRLLVPEPKKAWHCGGSIMPSPDARQGVNDFSIGIELMATQRSGYTHLQYLACAALCRDIDRRFGSMQYIGHEDIAGETAVALGLRKDIKTDPGQHFDWCKFHEIRNTIQENLPA